MYNYSLQNHRQLDTSLRYRYNETSCTRLRKNFDFWSRYGVPFFLYGLDIGRSFPLLLKLMIEIYNSFFLTHNWLAFEKDHDKKKKWNMLIIFYKKDTYTVKLIELTMFPLT